jgi:hypothetical protein
VPGTDRLVHPVQELGGRGCHGPGTAER